MAKRIAIVEDDFDQRNNYKDAIEKKGYQVVAYDNRAQAFVGLKEALPDLVILDIILGTEVEAGFELCRDLLVESPLLPVIFLTERIDEIDKVSGLRLGAWDYLSKPISLNYLTARISSLLRINQANRAGQDNPQANKTQVVSVGELVLHEEAFLALWKGEPINLSGTEFRILLSLVRTPGHVVSYNSLKNATMQSLVTHNTINTHMHNIRKKIRRVDRGFACIRSEYGYGYRWSTQ